MMRTHAGEQSSLAPAPPSKFDQGDKCTLSSQLRAGDLGLEAHPCFKDRGIIDWAACSASRSRQHPNHMRFANEESGRRRSLKAALPHAINDVPRPNSTPIVVAMAARSQTTVAL